MFNKKPPIPLEDADNIYVVAYHSDSGYDDSEFELFDTMKAVEEDIRDRVKYSSDGYDSISVYKLIKRGSRPKFLEWNDYE